MLGVANRASDEFGDYHAPSRAYTLRVSAAASSELGTWRRGLGTRALEGAKFGFQNFFTTRGAAETGSG